MTARLHGPIVVDPQDAHLLADYTWRRHSRGYARRSIKTADRKTVSVFLHREIMQPPTGMFVDHVNGDVLDNRRCNLRLCTQSQNCANTHQRIGKWGYRGVFRTVYGVFFGNVRHKGLVMNSKTFDTPEAAARARDEIALSVWGPFARLNFPQECAA
jgi:hypothetical protein